MSELLGWIRAEEGHLDLTGCTIERGPVLCRVSSKGPVRQARDNLQLKQACFRHFKTFLPNSCGLGEVWDENRILQQIGNLTGLGQLRLAFARVDRPQPVISDSGKHHLRVLQARRNLIDRWKSNAEEALGRVTKALQPRATQLVHGKAGMIADLLLPREAESGVAAQVEMALAGQRAPDFAVQLTISGLWAPLAFSDWRSEPYG